VVQVNSPNITRKAPEGHPPGVFFRLLFGVWVVFLGAIAAAADNCALPGEREVVQLAKVHDGDTLRLMDGRRVRIIGVNAPELARKGVAAEPLAVDARNTVERFIEKGEKVQLVYERERHDRYGRYLAHVLNHRGQSVAEHLLEKGLAFAVAVPPNVGVSDCLFDIAAQARDQGAGIWALPRWQAREVGSLQLSDTGFQRVRGKVMSLSEGKDIWLELNGSLVVKIAADDKRYFKGKRWRRWKGRNIEIQGWVIRREPLAREEFKPLQLQLRTPHALRLLPD